MENKKTLTVRIVIFAAIVIGIVILMQMVAGGAKTTTKYDAFAQCLGEKGATFYGAFWCPHCQEQKRMFGGSAKLLPYQECSTADGKSQNATCRDAGIGSYPTWEFADGSRQGGVMSIDALAEKTGCVVPREQ